MNSLLLSMPGSPCLYYGDEIGMGDNFYLGDRNGVRTPMQWSPDRNAGFSRADPQRLYLPPIMDPVYGFGSVNVEAQLRERGSLLNWTQRVLALRKNHQAFGRGELVFLHPKNRKILAYFRLYQDDIILCVANLSRAAQAVELDLSRYKGCVPVELMGRASFPPIGELPYLLTLPGHHFYWFRLASDEEIPAWHEEHLPPEELPTLVLFDGWNSFFPSRVLPSRVAIAEKARTQLEEEVLPHFVVAQRWYGTKGEQVRRVAIEDHVAWGHDDNKWLVALFSIEGALGKPYACFLPLALAWENGDEKHLRAMSPTTIAKVRQQAEIGILADAFADASFCQAVVQAIATCEKLSCEKGTIHFSPTQAFSPLTKEASNNLSARQLSSKGSNTAVVLGEQLFLKGYRYLQNGTCPEIEVGRFLTEVAKFPNIAPVLGIVEYVDSEGQIMTLTLLQEYVKNQGDCWNYTIDYLNRFLEEYRSTVEPPVPLGQAHAAYLVLIRLLGQRTAELHNALGKTTGDSAFDPEPVINSDVSAWIQSAQAEALATLDLIERREAELAVSVRELAQTLRLRRNLLIERLRACNSGQIKSVKTRYHGDLNLGNVLINQNDFVFTDFKGNLKRPFAERLHKCSPLRDVADMLLSFNYAGYTALGHVCAEQPKDMAKFEHLVLEWEREVGRVFLEAYTQTVSDTELILTGASVPALLELFQLEKALYDVRNELGNHSDLVIISLKYILSRL